MKGEVISIATNIGSPVRTFSVVELVAVAREMIIGSLRMVLTLPFRLLMTPVRK
jgi:hypothetical protein